MKTGIVYEPIYLKHDTGEHVENAGRLESIISHLEKTGLKEKLTVLKPRPATIADIALVHDGSHISRVKKVAQNGGGWLDPDTLVCPNSYEVALQAAGGVIRAVEAVMSGQVNNAFAAVRPPGHHSTKESSMGFCLFNNIAIAAKYALSKFHIERIAIVDFDVHHGNGTQEAFYDSPQVLYVSTHQHPFYPGSGSVEETGTGPGKGFTVNIPLPAGCGDNEYRQVYNEIVVPAVRRFNPQLIMVSAGYDCHWADSLALMRVSTTGFAQMVTAIKGLAEEMCEGRLVMTLEGGYNLKALACSVKATFDVLLGNNFEDPLGPPPDRYATPGVARLIETIKSTHGLG